jgi:quercetin 2,3-dioxygenase
MAKASRRNFMTKVAVGASAIIIAPFAGVGKWFKGLDTSENPKKKSIKSKTALGFQWDTLDPFLFCVHHEDYFPKGTDTLGPDVSHRQGRELGDDFIIKDGFRMYHGRTVPGFPGHPHRGFETITVVRKGFVDHHDSLGAAGRYGNGDVQWMTAGKGVQHSEMFPLLNKDKDNPMELFQIWLNLPKKNKMVEAHFKMLWNDTIPNHIIKDANNKTIRIEVIAGDLDKNNAYPPPPDSWASSKEHNVAIWNIDLEAGAKWTMPKTEEGVNRMLYFYEGESIEIAGETLSKYHAMEVEPTHDLLINNGDHESKILMLQGKPIGEPVIQYGPFVMNTKAEINQAFQDYHDTKFGGWPWPSSDPVHAQDQGRFALYTNGKKVQKDK